MLEPIKKLGLEYSFYRLNHNFEVEFDFNCLEKSDVFIYVNYFGVCEPNVKRYVDFSKKMGFNICIDNTQSFYSTPYEGIDTFYSPRKFFGVPDGAYLYTDQCMSSKLKQEIGYDKSIHLLKRIDRGPSETYNDYKKVSLSHSNQEIKKMSYLSQSLLSSINYPVVKKKRIRNFSYINQKLKIMYKLSIDDDDFTVPMVYPFFIDSEDLRKHLISNRIFVATYWKEVLDNTEENQLENSFVNNIIPLPIDQRYEIEDMKFIVEVILDYINSRGGHYEEEF